MNFAQFAIDKRVISSVASLLFLLAGYFAYTQLPRFEDPEFIIRQAQIIIPYPGASAREVEEEVTDVIENAIQQLQGVKQVKSVSSLGQSEVTVEFTIEAAKTRAALNQKFSQLRAKISDTHNKLPPSAVAPMVFDDFGDVYALYYAIAGEGYSLSGLHDYAKQLQKQLVLVNGVSKVTLTGVPEEVVYLDYQPSKLVQLGLSSQQIAQVLEGQSSVVPAGSVAAGRTRLVIQPTTAVTSLNAIEDIIITSPQTGRSFRLRDISNVRRGLKKPANKILFRDGKPVIGLGVSNKIGGNVVNMGDAVKVKLTELEKERPLGIKLLPISNQSESVRVSVADFTNNVLLALVIVVGTLLIFMGLRSGFLMGGILLITVAGTLFGMYAFGLDMQRISLGALIIALGMLVDNAIVVVEGTLVRTQRGESPASASIAVANKTVWPLLGGTIVGFLAFSPIGFSPDNTGEYTSSLFWTITIALTFSWLVAVWLAPYYCTLLLKAAPIANTQVPQKESSILASYRLVLKLAIRFRWLTTALVLVIFVASIAGFSFVKSGFFPASTRAQFVVDYNLPAGTDIQQTTVDIHKISAFVRKLEGVTGTNTVVGGGHLRFMLTYSGESPASSYAQILVDVEDFHLISQLLSKIDAHIKTNYPGAYTKVWKFVLGPGGNAIIQARFTGPDPVVLRSLANKAKAVLVGSGAINVKDNWGEMVKVIRPRINEQNTKRVGLTRSDISKAIAERFVGTAIGVFREGNELRQIIFRPEEKYRSEIDRIRDIQIFSSSSGKYIPIGQVVDRFDVVFENQKLRRFNRSLAIMAEADPALGVNGGELFEVVRGGIEAISLSPGYALEWRGQYGNSIDANAGLASTMPFGFGAMVVIVILLFNAFRQPLIIFLTVPLALIGVVLGLVVTGTPMEFMAILGVLSLTGMLIKNAIVLIDETDSQISDGKARMSAVIDGAVSRVRPVTLGVLTTVLGVVPLLWDPFFESLAVVIIWGLSFATILTLIIVPTLYALFFRVKNEETEE